MIINILLAILVLSIVVIVHEFGHFIVAKANGVTVVEFSIGFGPRLLHIKKGETIYSIKLLPFGGSCMMLGDDYMEVESEDSDEEEETSDLEQSAIAAHQSEKSFSNKSVWARIAIIAAGPINNFLLAFVFAVIIIGSLGFDPCTVDRIYEDSPAAEAGLQLGDRITEVNGEKITFAREYSFLRYYYGDEPMEITYVRDGETYETTLVPEYVKTTSYLMGITISTECAVTTVTENSPAAAGGLREGDIIRSINGADMHSATEITEAVGASEGNTIPIVISRNGEELSLSVTPELTETESYYTGFSAYGARVKTSPLKTIQYSVSEVGYWVKTVIRSLGMMFSGQLGINDLSGPVGAVNVMSNVVEESRSAGTWVVILNLLNLGVMISANLGVMNLLPIPAIDGGRLVFLIIEAVRGKPVKKEREGMVHFIGMILLMLLMVYIMFKDIKGLF